MGVLLGLIAVMMPFVFIIGAILLASGVRVVNQYEKGVVFRLGKVMLPIKEPGLRFIVPMVDKMRKVSLRTVTLPVEKQKIITRDNVSIDVAAVAYFQVVDPIKSIVEIENVISATYQIAQTTVRNVVGQTTLDHVLSETGTLNEKVKSILDVATEKWGIYVSNVELKDISLPDSMQRAMAKEAEAEREKRAKIIAAEGEAQSAVKLGEAADIIAAHPIALQLRNLQVLSEIAVEKNSTIIFPSQFMDSVDSVKNFMAKLGK
jgi:regulator of protease activity HflC (stomatin/prohibitin superfamily)